MVQKIVNIPEEDLSLFLELAKKFDWKIMSETSKMEEPEVEYKLTPEQIIILEERSKTPFSECVSKEDFLKFIDEL